MNDIPRERKSAIVDKRRSQINYMKSDKSNSNKNLPNIYESNFIEEKNNDLPNPPIFSKKEKNYCIDTKTKVNKI